MKIFKLILIVILIVKAGQTETLEEKQDNDNDDGVETTETDMTENDVEDEAPSLEVASDKSDNNENNEDVDDDDVEGRSFTKIELYTNDARCTTIGVCSAFYYPDRNVIVSFNRKLEVVITTKTTYEFKKPQGYYTLTFVDSNFSNFPLQLFYAFQPEELDFRNCSLKSLKWDNFLGADKLSILLLSENRLQEIQSSLFALAENLSFLFLDANRISVLHYDSFKGLEKLNFLDLHNNQLETLPSDVFSYLPSLQQINLAENHLQIIDAVLFANNPSLFSIHLQHNALEEIQDYAFQEQRIIKYLDFSHNPQLEVLMAAKIRVENLWAKNCSISRVNIYGIAVHVDLQQNYIKELYFSQPEYLETLRLKDNALEQISSLALSTNLRTLDVSNNPDLKTLPDLMQVNALERLDLSNTSLHDIPLSLLMSPNKLRSLNVSLNRIEEIDPLSFKYLEKLTQFYIHHNNWNCYNLKMLMDVVIQPLKISYTPDEFDDSFPGEYIHGVQCMYRLEPADDEYYVDSLNSQQMNAAAAAKEDINVLPAQQLDYNRLKFENTKEVENLRHELKAIVNIYEQKFSLVLNKLNELDLRLKEFERFNKTMWQQVSIVV